VVVERLFCGGKGHERLSEVIGRQLHQLGYPAAVAGVGFHECFEAAFAVIKRRKGQAAVFGAFYGYGFGLESVGAERVMDAVPFKVADRQPGYGAFPAPLDRLCRPEHMIADFFGHGSPPGARQCRDGTHGAR